MNEEYPGNFDIALTSAQVLEKAVKIIGSQAELARRLEREAQVRCYPQKINEWRARGIIPPYWVRPLADVTGIPRKEIDPLLYD